MISLEDAKEQGLQTGSCKWCRKPIIRIKLRGAYKDVEWQWCHESGMFSCPTHPETHASPADERWEIVSARIGSPESIENHHERAMAYPLTHVVEFRIDLTYKGFANYYVQRVDPQHFVMANFDVYKVTLEFMIESIDAFLDSLDEKLKE